MMLRRTRVRQFHVSRVITGSKPPSILRRNEHHGLDSREKVTREASQPKRLKIVKLLPVKDCARKVDGHIAQADPLALHRCDHCAKSFLSSLDLAEHSATVHPVVADCTTNGNHVAEEKLGFLNPDDPMSVFHCPACDFTSRSNLALKTHFVRRHTEHYEYKCELCPRKFKVRRDLTTHVRFQHKEKPVGCDVCGKVYKNSASLYAHRREHYKATFECTICHRRMITRENLEQHILIQHEKREKIACAECGKIFPKLSRLKRHLLVHSDQPYKCYVCKKTFVLKTDLMNHLPVHNSSRPYSCDICGLAFAKRSSLVSHEKSHTSTQQFTDNCSSENLQAKTADNTVADDSEEEENKEEVEEGLEVEYEEQIEEILEIEEYKPA